MATITTEKKTRKLPVSADPARIFQGALKLPLKERADLVKELQSSISAEVTDLKAKADEAAKIAGA